MNEPEYIHGMQRSEQERLAALNRLTNPPFLEFIALEPSDRVLEVGSGLGILANEVARRVPQGHVTGVEFSPEQLGSAIMEQPNLRLMRGDAHELPFASDSFDLVYCRYVLEHVRDPLKVLREMNRVLKPGGRALAQENNMRMMVFDPDCPHLDALLPAFCELQRRLGGDALIGKRLYALFKHAGFREIELSYQPEIHPASSPTFKIWIDNAMGLIDGASGLLVRHGLATTAAVESALAELSALHQRDDASGLFHWNRAIGIK